jgi:hypothetical protein
MLAIRLALSSHEEINGSWDIFNSCIIVKIELKPYAMLRRKISRSVTELCCQVSRPAFYYGRPYFNLDKVQVFQNKVLPGIVDVPWYYRNDHLHRDLNLPTIRQVVQITF